MPRGRPPKFANLVPAAIAYYESGHSFNETAKHIGCDPNTLHLWLKRANYQGRETKYLSMAKNVSEISAFYLDGRTLKETAEHYGCSERTLREFFHDFGVPTSYAERTERLHKDGWFCPACKRLIPREGWHDGGRYLRPGQAYCRECENERRRNRYHERPGKEREYAVARRPKRSKQTRENRFLALDHIHGGGRRHRNNLTLSGVITPEQYYKWIRDSGFPDLFRVLCHNCNMSLGHYGFCPHRACRYDPDPSVLDMDGRKRLKAKQRRRSLRIQALEGYGGKCACCGEHAFEFLAIDHVNGGGKKHISELIEQRITRLNYLKWHIAKGFPQEFRVLCHNCNMARGFYKHCPHVARD